jgi:hypothetical protein
MKLTGSRSWIGFPLDPRIGETPGHKDTPPERTARGDFILYHGTSSQNAKTILKEKRLRPDDMGVVGVGTTREAVGPFAAMKGGADGVRLRVVISEEWLSTHEVRHEIGGIGHDQFLIERLDGEPRNRGGIPPEAILEIEISKEIELL